MSKKSVNDYLKNLEKPRERLIKEGPSSLKLEEIIAILLRTGSSKSDDFSPDLSAINLAREILKKFKNDLIALSNADYGQLKQIKGIGDAKAATIIAAFELARRLIREKTVENIQFTTPTSVFDFLRGELSYNNQETTFLLTLKTNNSLINCHKLTIGNQSMAIVDVKEIIRKALYDKATGIIFAHNHPSGNVEPSTDDIEITKKIYQACKFFSIRFLDHIIFSPTSYFSFTKSKLPPFDD